MRNLITKTMVLVLIATLFATAPAWAESKSATVQVSCTILPIIEITRSMTPFQSPVATHPGPIPTPRNELVIVSQEGLVSVKTNLGKNYSMSETLEKTGKGLLKLYSVTAL